MAASLRHRPRFTPGAIREHKSHNVILRPHRQVIWLVSNKRKSEDAAQISGHTVFSVRKLVRPQSEGGPDAPGDCYHHTP